MGDVIELRPKTHPTIRRRARTNEVRLGGVTPEQAGSWLTKADRTGDIRDLIRLYEKLTEESTIAAAFGTRRSNVGGQPYRIETTGTEPIDAECAQALERVLEDMGTEPPRDCPYSEDALDFDGMTNELLVAPHYSFAAVETEWDYRGGLWVPVRAWRVSQDRFRWPQGHPPLLVDDGERYHARGLALQPGGWVVHIPRANPGARTKAGGFRAVAFLYVFKRHAMTFYLKGAEKYSFPWIHGKLAKTTAGKTTAGEDMREKLRDELKDLQEEFIAVTSGIEEIKLLESTQKDAQLLDRLINSLNREIDKAIIGHTDSSEPTKVGAYAAVKTRFGNTASPRIAGDEKALARDIRNQFTRTFVELNKHRFEGARVPWIRRDVGEPTPLPDGLIGRGYFKRNQILRAYSLEPEPPGVGDLYDNQGPAGGAAP